MLKETYKKDHKILILSMVENTGLEPATSPL